MRTQTLDRSTLAEALKAFLRVLEPETPAPAPPAPAPRTRWPSAAVDPQFEHTPPSPRPAPKLLTFKELHQLYKISRPGAYILINQGKLERVKIGRRALITDASARALLVKG
jgi:hypothetical protein